MTEPDRQALLSRYATGTEPANIVLMRLLMGAGTLGDVEQAVATALVKADGAARPRFAALAALLDEHRSAFATIRAVMAEASHDRPAEGGAETVAHWTRVFDRLAGTAPEAAVALYALGSPDLLARATEEVVAKMRDWGLLGSTRTLLDLGCGIGRLSIALSREMACVIGLDASGEMVAEAGRRGAGLPNLAFRRTTGHDLAGVPDRSVDVVLAADVFPYLVAAGSGLAERHVEEAARVLKRGGALLILNYSYRGDDRLDRRDVGEAFGRNGFVPERDGTRDFALWDAVAFLGRLS